MVNRLAVWIEFRHQRMALIVIVYIAFILMGTVMGSNSNAYLAFLSAAGTGPFAWVVFALPLLATLVAGDVIVQDRKSRMHIWALTRTRRTAYAGKKIVQLHVLTASVFGLGSLVTLGLFALLFPGGFSPNDTPYPFLPALLALHPFRYVLAFIGLITLAAIAWSAIALALSVWTSNVYVVLGGPWFLCMIFSVLLQAMNLTEYAPIMWSGAVIRLTTHAASNPLIIPALVLGITMICDGIVIAAYARGGDILD